MIVVKRIIIYFVPIIFYLSSKFDDAYLQPSWASVFFKAPEPRRLRCSYGDYKTGCWEQKLADSLSLEYVTNEERLELRETVREMFYFGYDNYMRHAFPLDELNPIFCCGRGSDKERPENINVNDALGDYILTLVDSLDTLVVIGDVEGFQKAVSKLLDNMTFSASNVQVFESTIRILGGLLSAHLAVDHPNRLVLYGKDFRPENYDGELLSLARELGTRLLPAFDNAPLGIPWPRVNLKYGVLQNCSHETATAGPGTLLLEFGLLSRLTGDPIFESVAYRALRSLYSMRHSKTGLLGAVIDILKGDFVNPMSGVGASLDSLYEYLLKSYILFSTDDSTDSLLEMYETLLASVKDHMRIGRPICNRGNGPTPLYVNVDFRSGEIANNWIDSLQAAFSAILTLSGEVNEAICQHAVYSSIWRRYGVLPERFNYRLKAPDIKFYPLRPEFVEATYLLYQATKNPFYLSIGKRIVEDLNANCKAKCGFATVHDVETMELEDRQESFFLAETVKYLYLLFDVNHSLNHNSEKIVFTTEGHIIPLGRWKYYPVSSEMMSPSQVRIAFAKVRRRKQLTYVLPNENKQLNDSVMSTLQIAQDSLNNSKVSAVISSRSCENVENLRYAVAPLEFRYLQQIDAEIGLSY